MSCLKICEECEWISNSECEEYKHHCLLTNQETGLLCCCDKFRRKTGEHISNIA